MKKNTSLPAWADVVDQVIEFDPEHAYEEVRQALKIKKWDQYWLEVARRLCTNRLKVIVRGDLSLMNALASTGLKVRILKNDAVGILSRHPKGKGADLGATEFRLFMESYMAAVRELAAV